jgi:hypothetical protein
MQIRPVFALVLTLLASCGTGEDPSLSGSPTPATTTASPTIVPGLEGASCDKQTGGDQGAAMLLTDLRVARQPGADRITLEFEPREGQEALVPYHEVQFTEPPLRQDGSGEEMTVEGQAFLSWVTWASGVDLGSDEVREVYTGPKTIDPPDTEVIQQLSQGGDFENVLTWYVGLSERKCFVVRTLTDPIRIVVDVATD